MEVVGLRTEILCPQHKHFSFLYRSRRQEGLRRALEIPEGHGKTPQAEGLRNSLHPRGEGRGHIEGEVEGRQGSHGIAGGGGQEAGG